jgi:hypothetical protein
MDPIPDKFQTHTKLKVNFIVCEVYVFPQNNDALFTHYLAHVASYLACLSKIIIFIYDRSESWHNCS